MTKQSKPPGGRSGGDDADYPSDVEIVAMTMRHGADHVKRYLNAITLERASRGLEDDAHA